MNQLCRKKVHTWKFSFGKWKSPGLLIGIFRCQWSSSLLTGVTNVAYHKSPVLRLKETWQNELTVSHSQLHKVNSLNTCSCIIVLILFTKADFVIQVSQMSNFPSELGIHKKRREPRVRKRRYIRLLLSLLRGVLQVVSVTPGHLWESFVILLSEQRKSLTPKYVNWKALLFSFTKRELSLVQFSLNHQDTSEILRYSLVDVSSYFQINIPHLMGLIEMFATLFILAF